MILPTSRALAVAALVAIAAQGQDRPDLTLADFEGEGYQPWVVQGEAFGQGPARGTLPGQMAVEGFEGKGLASSFVGGDDSTGTLTSPPFVIERTSLNFRIGGGKFPGRTCLDLLIDGKVVRTATGPNDRPGGSERLEWQSWGVADLPGKTAVLRVVDARKGGWGHISVDQIVQSDRPRGDVPTSLAIDAGPRYLILPVAGKAPLRRVKVLDGGQVVREFDIRLAEGSSDFSSFLDVSTSLGKELQVEAKLPVESKALGGITRADRAVDPALLYREPGRPQFHFTSRRGWLNDPNGLVYFEGEYHLFYQHNPYGWQWGNMHWGHAVSPDLVHWKELPIALHPREYGDWAFSGSAVVDRDNTSGFGRGGSPPLVGAYTSTARGECLIYSLDRGRTWAEYAGNPVVRHVGRDPRLLWHAPTKRWVMAIYDEEGGRQDFVFHSSPDLKAWTFESRIAGFFECPDLFELPVDGASGRTFWVLLGADGEYRLGQFDGKSFRPEPGGKRRTWHGNFYASQTFSDEPKGRRIQVGWAQGIDSPGEPFNQQMNVPCELTLRSTKDGIRMFANPVAELDGLSVAEDLEAPLGFGPGESTHTLSSDLLDIRAEVEVEPSGRFSLAVPNGVVDYDAARRSLACNGVSTSLEPSGGLIKLRILVDRNSVEVFGNDGLVAISRGARERTRSGRPTLKTSGEGFRFRSLKVGALGPAW